MPTNFAPKDPNNPYVDYGEDRMFAFLADYALPRDIGSKYEYSNLGGGLLGDALAHRSGLGYEALVKRRITGPLEMRDTAITLSPELKARLAQGHTAILEPTPNWDLTALAPAGALRSDAKDMLTFLGAELGYVKTPLKAAMDAQHVDFHPTNTPAMSVALAWHSMSWPGRDTVIWHNGGTGGYKTFIGFDPKTGVGVTVLTNASTTRGGDDIGFYILTGAPLTPPPKPRTIRHAIALDPKAFDALVGVYRFAPQVAVTFSREGEHAYVQATGQMRSEILAETRDDYFSNAADIQFTFNRAPDGSVSGVTLHENGLNLPGKREAAP
jgi:CubicO group peptidase (beta-lactamase class C family)